MASRDSREPRLAVSFDNRQGFFARGADRQFEVLAYFQRADYLRRHAKCCQDSDIPDILVIIIENDVRRGDLLFQIELDTVATMD